MKKRLIIFITVLLTMIFIVGFMIVNTGKKVELVQAPKSTMEPYQIYNEWDPKFFEEYGFKNLILPGEATHERIEKGESYVIGSFYTTDFDKFEFFFQQIYRVLWGEIYDATKVLELEDSVYSFKERCMIPQIVEKGEVAVKDAKSDYMTIDISFDDKENKVTLECRKEITKKDKSKDDKKKNTEEDAEGTTKEDGTEAKEKDLLGY